MVENNICPICLIEGARLSPTTGDRRRIQCPRCSRFEHTRTVSADCFENLDEIDRGKLSGWIFEQNQIGSFPLITSENLKEILNIPFPSFGEKINRFLKLAVKKVPMHHHRQQGWTEPDFISGTFSINQSEVEQIQAFLHSRGLIRSQVGQFMITPEGYLEIDKLNEASSDSTQGFVALWFDDQMDEVWEKGFQPAIREAGYKAFKVDMKQHNNKIDDEIIAEIRRSRFLVADFTGHRGGVYFEAGFAKGLGLEVFWTCKEADKKKLHFDIRQFNFILWKDADDLKKQLKDRIAAVIGDGPNK